jgi:hypothetical protein
MEERVPKDGTQTKNFTQITGRKSLANQNPMSVFVKKHLPMDIPKSTKIRLRLSLDT